MAALNGNFTVQASKHGTFGWATGADSVDDYVLIWGDVFPVGIKQIEDVDWRPLLLEDSIPPGIIGPDGIPGSLDGVYNARFAGNNKDIIYVAVRDRVIKTTNGGTTFSNTAINGYPVYSNGGYQRAHSAKSICDPTDANFFAIVMGVAGLIKTTDGGATKTHPSWCPTPTWAGASGADTAWGLLAMNPANRNQIAVAISGSGVWMSSDKLVNGTNITGSSGIVDCADLQWVNGVLYASTAGLEDPPYSPGNLYRYLGSNNWELVRADVGYVCPDPRYPDGFWFTLSSGEYGHTQDGENFVLWQGYSPANGVTAWVQTIPRTRPLVPKKSRAPEYFIPAPSKWIVANDEWVIMPTGLGPERTSVADFPLDGAGVPDVNYSPKWPNLIEDMANYEGIVGMSTIWYGDRLWCFCQDAGSVLWEFGERGHIAAIHKFPDNGVLTDVHGASLYENYLVVHRTRKNGGGAGQRQEPCISFTIDGYTWKEMDNQPTLNGSEIYASGHVVAGPNGECFAQFSYGSHPQFVSGYGEDSNTWADCIFLRENSTQLDLDAYQYSGFHGADFSKNHHPCVYDPVNDCYYIVNIGAGYNGGPNDFQNDPYDTAGIYRMVRADVATRTFRRIHDGHPTPFGNRATFDCELLVTPDGDRLIFNTNYLPSIVVNGSLTDNSNKVAIYTIATDTLQYMNSPTNIRSMWWGATPEEDGNLCLQILGWSAEPNDEYGIYIIQDISELVNPVLDGPYEYRAPTGGHVQYINAHQTKFGRLGGAVVARGHVYLEWEDA